MFNVKLHEYLGLINITEGDVGIEVEMEMSGPTPKAPNGWSAVQDHSLKGLFGVEYVTKGAVPHGEVSNYIKRLSTRLKNSGHVIEETIRAGVHVHVNCQPLTVNQTLNFAVTYLVLEKILTKFCGPDREGNLFCLRAVDAEYLPHLIGKALTEGNINYLNTQDIRYSSLNMYALFKFGTLEFRSMKTYADLGGIEDWINILLKVRDYGASLKSRSDIADRISFHGPELWVREVLGDHCYNIIKHENIDEDIMSSLRVVQSLLYK